MSTGDTTAVSVMVYLSVGANIDPIDNIQSSIDVLQSELADLSCAPWYQSPAVGFDGAAFLNTVIAGSSQLPLRRLSERLREIEDEHGRDRRQPRFSSRPLDLDVLLYGDEVRHDGELDVPRAELNEQAYILQPLADIAPQILHPELLVSIATLRDRLQAIHPQRFAVLDQVRESMQAVPMGSHSGSSR